jgi:hypothetical protein
MSIQRGIQPPKLPRGKTQDDPKKNSKPESAFLLGKLKMKNKAWIEKILGHLDFVQWDRYYSFGMDLAFYGWIEREEDEYKDFVVIVVDNKNKRVTGYHCSSPEYSEKVGDYLNTGHSKCQRVEDKISIDNMVELEGN